MKNDMKARIKATGKIVEGVFTDDGMFMYVRGDKLLVTRPENIGIVKDDIDFEQRRFELVKAAMQGLLTVGKPDSNEIVRKSFEYADAVLAEYRKGGEE